MFDASRIPATKAARSLARSIVRSDIFRLRERSGDRSIWSDCISWRYQRSGMSPGRGIRSRCRRARLSIVSPSERRDLRFERNFRRSRCEYQAPFHLLRRKPLVVTRISSLLLLSLYCHYYYYQSSSFISSLPILPLGFLRSIHGGIVAIDPEEATFSLLPISIPHTSTITCYWTS